MFLFTDQVLFLLAYAMPLAYAMSIASVVPFCPPSYSKKPLCNEFSNFSLFRIEFEQNLAANEQTGPINREMRHLITSLQNHNQQLKGEVSRYKRKLKEAQNELAKVKNGGGEEKGSGECASTSSATSEDENKKDDGAHGGDKGKGIGMRRCALKIEDFDVLKRDNR